jgi:hypothetical protein
LEFINLGKHLGVRFGVTAQVTCLDKGDHEIALDQQKRQGMRGLAFAKELGFSSEITKLGSSKNA